MANIQRFGSNARLSEAVCANGFVFLSGIVPEDTSGNITAQTTDVLKQMDYDGMNVAWDAWVDTQNTPARACVQASLAKPEWKVEIKISAVQKS